MSPLTNKFSILKKAMDGHVDRPLRLYWPLRLYRPLRLNRLLRAVVIAAVCLRTYIALRIVPAFDDERGEIASTVIMIAILAAAAIAIGGIIVAKITATAQNIQTP
jgi:hypothetical protein